MFHISDHDGVGLFWLDTVESVDGETILIPSFPEIGIDGSRITGGPVFLSTISQEQEDGHDEEDLLHVVGDLREVRGDDLAVLPLLVPSSLLVLLSLLPLLW